MAETALKMVEEEVWKGTEKRLEELRKEALQTPETQRVEKMSVIAGFPVTEVKEISVKNRSHKKVERIEQLKDKRARFREELRSDGIKPLAVVPARVWQSLCRTFKLFRFECLLFNEYVPADVGNLAKCFRSPLLIVMLSIVSALSCVCVGSSLSFAVAIGLFVSALWVGIAFFFEKGLVELNIKKSLSILGAIMISGMLVGFMWISSYKPAYSLEGCLKNIGVATSMGVGAMMSFTLFVYACLAMPYIFKSKGLRVMFRFIPHKVLIRSLFPKYCDTISGDTTDAIRVSFPKPPVDVGVVLKRARDAGYTLCVAADASAVGISHESLARSVREHLKNDPVIYVKKDGLVAIIAQFGDFPSEKKCMDALKKMDMLEFIG